MSKTNAVANVSENSVIVAEIPEFLRDQTTSRGAEEVKASDLIIPRLEVVQSLSPCRKKTDPAYIEGAEEGMLFNNVTRELYGTEAVVIPVYFRKQYLLWKDRKKGGGTGGFRGAFPNELAAREAVINMEEGDIDVAETNEHFCLLVRNNGKVEEIVLSMAKSKMKVSRRWNSLIRMNGGDSFSRAYKVSGVSENNQNGDQFYNLAVVNFGYVTEEIYRRAEALYEQIASGAVKVDTTIDMSSDAAPSRNNEEF